MSDYTQELHDFLREQNAPRERKARKKPYVKPDCVRQLEEDWMLYQRERYPNVPYIARHDFRDDTANHMTAAIIAWLKLRGYFAARVNTTGTYNAKLGRYIKSGSTRGMADISAVIEGRSVQIEVKAGHDRPRAEQLKVQEQVRAAGGEYFFVHSLEEFIGLVRPLTLPHAAPQL